MGRSWWWCRSYCHQGATQRRRTHSEKGARNATGWPSRWSGRRTSNWLAHGEPSDWRNSPQSHPGHENPLKVQMQEMPDSPARSLVVSVLEGHCNGVTFTRPADMASRLDIEKEPCRCEVNDGAVAHIYRRRP
jgi:hypothetical protein